MGIAPYKTFTFDGESSGDYGVYITGTGVFNAPERSVEMVEIAGRNGSFALDKGKFENIEVTYRVGIVDDSEADFADRVSDFRNWLCSKVGYCRLEDEYNPNEYRMAVYASGMELEHDLLIAGEAEITFNCKPQRWLTSGETAVSVADGGTLDNPTSFESEPLLAVEGYGNINFNGYDIDIENVVLGDIILNNGGSFTPGGNSKTMFFNSETVNNGDALSSGVSIITARITTTNNNSFYWDLTNFSATDSNASFTTGTASMSKTQSGKNYFIEIPITIQPLSFVVGTNSTISNTTTYTINGKRMGSSTTFTITGTITTYVEYVSASYGVKFDQSMTATSSNANVAIKTAIGGYKMTIGQIEANSTVSALGNPTYIDCDLGECYMFGNNDEIVLLNQYIDLGSDLPRLVSGTNTINYDNTITDFKVTPRWWKV